MKIYLATNQGFIAAETGDSGSILYSGLEGKQITSLTVRKNAILAGTAAGIFHSNDAGQTWNEASVGLSHAHVRWMASHPESPGCDFAGTEPAAIFMSRDGGSSWSEIPEVSGLRDQLRWSLPYSPEAGCVRGFTFHGSRGYAAVEVGGVLRSDDSGASWRLAEGSDGKPGFRRPPEPWVHPDVHSILVHPSSPDLVFAPTGGGFYRSIDGGATWRCLYECYCRAVWVDPGDARHILFGPADGVDAFGRIEESRDGGISWGLISAGLAAPWPRYMVERFTRAGSELLAVLSNGQLLAAPLDTLTWRTILPDVTGVNAVAAAE